jgi:hypothetical protein
MGCIFQKVIQKRLEICKDREPKISVKKNFPLRIAYQRCYIKDPWILFFKQVSVIPFSPKTIRLVRNGSLGLALLFLISILTIPIHHHDDASFHSDCPICLSINLPFLANNNTSLIETLFQGIDYNIPEIIIPKSNLFTDFKVPRAPPSI